MAKPSLRKGYSSSSGITSTPSGRGYFWSISDQTAFNHGSSAPSNLSRRISSRSDLINEHLHTLNNVDRHRRLLCGSSLLPTAVNDDTVSLQDNWTYGHPFSIWTIKRIIPRTLRRKNRPIQKLHNPYLPIGRVRDFSAGGIAKIAACGKRAGKTAHALLTRIFNSATVVWFSILSCYMAQFLALSLSIQRLRASHDSIVPKQTLQLQVPGAFNRLCYLAIFIHGYYSRPESSFTSLSADTFSNILGWTSLGSKQD